MTKEIKTSKTMAPAQEFQFAPVGIQDYDPKDLILPRVLLMQGLSKFVQENGKKPGELVNSLTKETMSDIEFTPIVMSKYFDVLRPEGSQMVFDYRVTDPNDHRLQGKKFFTDADGHAEVNTVIAVIALIGNKPLAITFTKKSYRAGRKLLTLAVLSSNPLFWKKYYLKTVKETNKHGTFHVLDVEEAGNTNATEREEAQKLYAAFRTKAIDAHTQAEDSEEEKVPF